MSMGTHELLKQLDDAFKLCDQRTKDLELAARKNRDPPVFGTLLAPHRREVSSSCHFWHTHFD